MNTAPIVAGGDANPRQSVAPRREVTGQVVRRPYVAGLHGRQPSRLTARCWQTWPTNGSGITAT